MRATGVVSRFLPLLDVALLLLGLLMIVMMQASLTDQESVNPEAEQSIESKAGMDFIFLYAGWKDSQAGKCFLMEKGMRIGKEIRIDSKVDIDELALDSIRRKKTKNLIIFLSFSKSGWFDLWTPSRIKEIDKIWGMTIIKLYNVEGID